MLLQARQYRQIITNMVTLMIVGAFFGALFANPALSKYIILHLMTTLAVGLSGALAGLDAFNENRECFWRESSAGINRLSHFLAKSVAQLPMIVLSTAAFLSFHHALLAPRASFREYYSVFLVTYFATYGLGYCLSLSLPPASSQLATSGVLLVMAIVGGSNPTLCTLRGYGSFMVVIYNLSFARWTMEALFEINVVRYPKVSAQEIRRRAKENGYPLDQYELDILVLVSMAIFFHLLALILLVVTRRGEQNRRSVWSIASDWLRGARRKWNVYRVRPGSTTSAE